MQEKPNKPKKIFASLKSPIISGIISNSYIFKTREDAVRKITFIKNRFIKSRYNEELCDESRIIIWIKDYEITPEEQEKGALGNFAMIAIEARSDEMFTLSATKLNADVKFHPDRKRPKHKTPDWGHYILRKIRKNWRYATLTEAQTDLNIIAADFPEVSIPGSAKLYTMLFTNEGRVKGGGKPIQKYIFEITTLQEGGFTIIYRINTFERKTPIAQKDTPTETGRFVSMVELKRAKRRKVIGNKSSTNISTQ